MDAATNWRISLQHDNRQNFINMIMETLKNCFPDSGPEGLMKLNKMAEWFEKECYTDAKSKSDYIRRVSLKIMKMEKIFLIRGISNTIQANPLAPASHAHGMQSHVQIQQKSQIPLPNQSQAQRRIKPQTIQNATGMSDFLELYVTSLSQTSLSKAVCQSNNTQSGIAQNSVGSSENVFSNLQYLYQQLQQQPFLASIDSEAQTSYRVMYQQSQSIKEKHLSRLNDAYQRICTKCQKFDSHPNAYDSDIVERIKLYKNALERLMQMLNASKNNVEFVLKIASCEEQMISFLSPNRPQKPISAQQHAQKHGGLLLLIQTQPQQQQLKPDNQMNHQLKQSTVVANMCHESIDSNAQTTLNAVDQQEEIYKKIQLMKEKYLVGLNDMYQNISIECEQHDDSLLNVPNSERIERLKLTKNMLELAVRILNMSKSNIVPAMDCISHKKVGVNVIQNRPQVPASVQQQVQQPGGHPLSMQPQQQQHPDNPMQPSNMQKSVLSNQSIAVTSTCQASIDSKAQKGQNAVDRQEETYQKPQHYSSNKRHRSK